MATIVTRAGKGSALTHNEVDANFTNLNTDKVEKSGTDPVVISVNSSSNALRITQTGAGNALVVEDSANPDSTPTVVNADGRLILGTTSANSVLVGSKIQVSGTAGDAFVQAVRFNGDATGNDAGYILGRSNGTSFSSRSAVVAESALGSLVFAGDDGTNWVQGAKIQAFVDGTPGTNDMPGRLSFQTTADGASSPTERMRIDNAGQVGVGGTPAAGRSFVLAKNITGSTTSRGYTAIGIIQSDVTTTASYFATSAFTVDAAFTLTNLIHYQAIQSTISGGSRTAPTGQYGFHVDSTLTGATNNYGFFSNIASGTGRFNFYANGTADNYFAGSMGIGSVPSAQYKLFVGGTFPTSSSNSLVVTSEGTIPSGTTNAAQIFRSSPSTQAASFTLSFLTHFYANQGTIGATSAVTNQYGFLAETTLTGATNNYGFFSNIASGTGRWNFYANGTAKNIFAGQTSIGGLEGAESLRVAPVASAVNWIQVQGQVTGGLPAIFSAGSDTNIGMFYSTKGTGAHDFYTNVAAAVIQFRVVHTASAVNYLQASGGATGAAPYIISQGSDTNINLYFGSKGTGSITFATGSPGVTQFLVAHTASAVNYVQVTGAATGNAVGLSAQGSDTNIDLSLTPKGTGRVRFGTHTATADTAISGYIEIKDSAGNTRKLAVIT